MKEMIEKLEQIRKTPSSPLERYVAIEALKKDDPYKYLVGVVSDGCLKGGVSSLIFYEDTQSFFDSFYEDIEIIRFNYVNSIGRDYPIGDNDIKSTLAWFAYEEICLKILKKISEHLAKEIERQKSIAEDLHYISQLKEIEEFQEMNGELNENN